MHYGKPDDKDYIFISNGYKCALGLNYPNGESEPEEHEIRLLKTRLKGGPEAELSDWEVVHAFWTMDMQRYTDPVVCMREFLAAANPKLIAATGGGSPVPDLPEDFLQAIGYLVKNRVSFDAATGTLVLAL